MKINVEEVKEQLNLENAEMANAMDSVDLMNPCIEEFVGASELQAQAYDKFDDYFNFVSKPLIKAMLCMMEAKLEGNRLYYQAVERNLAGMGEVDYDKMVNAVSELEAQVNNLESNVVIDFLSEPYTFAVEKVIGVVKEKIRKVETFLSETNGCYSDFMTTYELARQGIMCAQSMGYNKSNGLMSSVPYNNLEWASTVRKYYEEKTMEIVNEKYGDYYEKNPTELIKLKTIVEYERFHLNDIEKTNKFLEDLQMVDQIGIKYVAYTAEEPYRSLWIDHLDDFGIKLHNDGSSAYYSPSDNMIVLDIEKCRGSNYHVFFHECGHAIDCQEGLDAKLGVYFSEEFVGVEGKSLDDLIRTDTEAKIGEYVDVILADGGYQYKYTDTNIIKENVIEYIMSGGDTDINNMEDQIVDQIAEQFASEAIGRENALVSDVYSGATNFELVGSYSHMNSVDSKGNYWYYNNGDVRRLPSVEYVAEYFAYSMTQNTNGLNSVRNYLGKSMEVMEEMLEKMANN